MTDSDGNAEDNIALAIIITTGPAPDGLELANAIRARIPSVEIFPDATNGSLLLQAEGLLLTVLPVDAPCPIGEADPSVKNAWYWPSASTAVKRHKAHLVVSAAGAANPKLRAALHGQLVAAAAEATPQAVAVHWAGSDSLWPADVVAKTIKLGDPTPPIMFCVASKLSRDADGRVSGRTNGLAAFGMMEIEARGFKGDPLKLNGLLLDLAAYLLDSGPVIKDGDTVGPDSVMKIVVRHENSSFVEGQKAYRLYFA